MIRVTILPSVGYDDFWLILTNCANDRQLLLFTVFKKSISKPEVFTYRNAENFRRFFRFGHPYFSRTSGTQFALRQVHHPHFSPLIYVSCNDSPGAKSGIIWVHRHHEKSEVHRMLFLHESTINSPTLRHLSVLLSDCEPFITFDWSANRNDPPPRLVY